MRDTGQDLELGSPNSQDLQGEETSRTPALLPGQVWLPTYLSTQKLHDR